MALLAEGSTKRQEDRLNGASKKKSTGNQKVRSFTSCDNDDDGYISDSIDGSDIIDVYICI